MSARPFKPLPVCQREMVVVSESRNINVPPTPRGIYQYTSL